jgi:hypothetical protein
MIEHNKFRELGNKNMKKYKNIGMAMCLFIAVIIPPNNQSSASITHAMNDRHFTYPVPENKPSNTITKQEKHDQKHINKKQAAVAALGLYLGYKAANTSLIQ